MIIRDRIKELRRIKASTLRPNPKNWRTHPENQQNAIKGILAEIGYADALLARELDDGTFELIDGHLRAETTPDQELPVLLLDLNDEEADLLLATLDPLAALAGTNRDLLAELTSSIDTENEQLRGMLDDILKENESRLETPVALDDIKDIEIPELYQVMVQCRDDSEQQLVYDLVTAKGLKCRILNM